MSRGTKNSLNEYFNQDSFSGSVHSLSSLETAAQIREVNQQTFSKLTVEQNRAIQKNPLDSDFHSKYFYV